MVDHVVIALFRHGITEANKRHAYLGWTDSPLISGEVFPEFLDCYKQIYTSDLGRCRETAKILFPQSNPMEVPELRELNFGDWEGHTYEELKDELSYQNWLADPFKIAPQNGESFAEFAKRVECGWSKIVRDVLERGLESAAVVTHGGVIRYLLANYAAEKKDFWEWRALHTQGYALTWKIEGLRRGERCISLQEVPSMVNQNGSGSYMD